MTTQYILDHLLLSWHIQLYQLDEVPMQELLVVSAECHGKIHFLLQVGVIVT